MKTFADIVEDVKQLSLEEKQELHTILKHILIEERRKEILRNHQESLEEYKAGKLIFYSNPEDLIKDLNAE